MDKKTHEEFRDSMLWFGELKIKIFEFLGLTKDKKGLNCMCDGEEPQEK